MGQENCHPKPGDLIEIDRPYHQHWALYVGDGYVINLTPVGKNGIVALGLRGLPEYIRKVKKQRLKDVVGKNKWDVNNKSDQYCSPLPVEEIMRRAEHSIDMEVTFHVFGSNCERFVKTLRYGDQGKNYVCGEMNIREMPQDRQNPSPGDLIEIKQPDINHWALYVGDGYVIHVTSVDESAPPVSASTETILTRNAKVKKELLKDVVGNDEWCVYNKYDWFRTPLPVQEIIHRAECYIGKEVPYDLIHNSSEDFVEKLRYGGKRKNFAHGEMNIPEMAHGIRYPEPGDLIEIKWPNHHHWALYMGDGYVIHVTSVDENAPPVSASTEPILTKKGKVKKELLKDVVGNHEWCVNNKYDWYHTPLPVEEIIWHAECYIGKEVPYGVLHRKCGRFVKRLRYGGKARSFVCGEMNIPEMAQDRHDPSPGDLIKIKWPNHHHWALYVGNGYVIHVTSVDESDQSVSASTVIILTKKGKVKKELLKQVVGNDEWCVYNKYDWYYTPLPVEEIIWHAECYIDMEVPCGVFGRKCGRFVKSLRYCDQVRNFVCGEMNIPEMAQDKHNPSPGDLIKIKQPDIHHWALYVGKGYVIHVTSVDESAPPVSASTETILTRKAKVKKELLKQVVGNDEWCVNNKYDWFRTPLPVELIIRHAKGYIGKEVEYCLFLNGSEHFVESVRYGDQLSVGLRREILPCEMAQNMTYPDPGDLIEIKRTGYQHWALYMGKGYVIHVTAVGEHAPALSASSAAIFTIKAMVKKELLKEVVRNNVWYVNNKYDLRRCPYPVEEILRRAEQWMDKEVPYRLLRSNCEHFVTMLRYGERASDQVLKALTRSSGISTAAGIGLAGACIVASNPLLLAAAGVGFFANIGLITSIVDDILNCLKFQRSPYDILEQMCC